MEQVQEQTRQATGHAFNGRMPELRFPEFSGEWTGHRLGEIATFAKGKGLGKSDIDMNGPTPCVRYAELYTIYTEVIIDVISRTSVSTEELVLSEGGEVIIPASGESAKDIATAACVMQTGVGLGGDLNIVRSQLDGAFLAYMLSGFLNNRIASYAQGASVVHLYPSQLKLLKLSVPGKEEQEKIAGFLGVVGARFGLLKRKKELLEAYKKGVMQKLFSREIRFKDEEGRGYPEWEEKRGNEVFSSISDKNHTSELPILAITQEKGAIPREFIDYDISVTPASISTYKVVREGDFIISLRSFQGGIEYSRYHGICSPAYIILRPHIPIYDGFFSAFLKTPAYIAQMTSKLEGIRDGKMVSYKYFSETKLPFPSLSEQEAIAGFIGLVSAKVDELCLQISESERFKKGLLQKMFV